MIRQTPSAAPPLPFLQNGVAQIAIVVPDLERAVEHYWRLCGVGPWHFYTYGRPLIRHMTYYGQPTDHRFRIALAYAGPMRMELIELQEGETVYADFVREHGYGVQHLGLLVEDMQTALEQARMAGLRVIMEGAGFGPDGDGYYAYLDTEALLGVTLELIERPKRRHPPEKIYPPEESSG